MLSIETVKWLSATQCSMRAASHCHRGRRVRVHKLWALQQCGCGRDPGVCPARGRMGLWRPELVLGEPKHGPQHFRVSRCVSSILAPWRDPRPWPCPDS
jgi:hypothetical protein